MTRGLFKLTLLLISVGIYAGVQAQTKPQNIPEASLEGTRRAIEGLRKRDEPLPQAKKIVDNQLVELAIAMDVVQQHQACFLNAEALKANKKELLDFDWTSDQQKKVGVIGSMTYRHELLMSQEFGGLKLGIASSLSASNAKVLTKALELSQDDVGADFVLAWIQPVLHEHIDKSCGRNPDEAVLDGWKSMFLWERLAKKFGLT